MCPKSMVIAGAALFVDRDLMAQNEKFHMHGEAGAEPGREGGEQNGDEG
jgi:hypothetical protein